MKWRRSCVARTERDEKVTENCRGIPYLATTISKSTLAGCWKLVTDATSPQRSRKGANMGQLLSLDWKQLFFIYFLFYVFSVCASFQLKIMKHHSKMAPLPSAGYSTLK
jgi:hypothetical protein